MQKMRHISKVALGLLLLLVPLVSAAAEFEATDQSVFRAEVVEVGTTTQQSVAGTDTFANIQNISVRFLEGPEAGSVSMFDNDYIQVKVGDRIFVNRLVAPEGNVIYGVKDVDRLGTLVWLILGFCAFVIYFAGWSGVRALLSVAVSLVIIIYLLFPLLLAGHSPVLISFLVASLVLAIAIVGGHGFSKISYAALLGTISSVALSGTLAWIAIRAARFTGFSGEESVYLNFNTHGMLDFQGLLLGGVIIGMLGVLDDVAITQASLVEELSAAFPSASRGELYARAIKVGKHHVQALINTLFLAYAGASLPLLLLLQTTSDQLTFALNNEVIAAEIVRTLVGSLGLIFAVPISTWFAVRLFENKNTQP